MNCEECGQDFKRVSSSKFCSVECRFIAKVDLTAPDECWSWRGALDMHGYGKFGIGRANPGLNAHRVCFELFVEPIPAGLQIDHLCRNRACVNPDHLEPVTSGENVLRGMAPAILTHRTGICQRGHSMGDAIVKSDGSGRECRTCHNARERGYRRASVANTT